MDNLLKQICVFYANFDEEWAVIGKYNMPLDKGRMI